MTKYPYIGIYKHHKINPLYTGFTVYFTTPGRGIVLKDKGSYTSGKNYAFSELHFDKIEGAITNKQIKNQKFNF